MKINRSFRLLQTQRGVSLVELMITMVIGLVMLIALGYFFLGSRQINRTTDDVSRMQESGRNALELIGKAVRQAGYRKDANVAFSGIALTGVDGSPDSITVQYEAQEGGEVDCAGNTFGAGAATELVTYAFAIAGATLTCNGVAQVDNVEDMQIEYGIDATKDGIVESYKTAPTVAEFAQVAAVRVILQVVGPSANIATAGKVYQNLSGVDIPVDGHLRQVYRATYTVRNQAG